MPVETDEERLIFLNPDEFGEEATLNVRGEDPRTIPALFSERSRQAWFGRPPRRQNASGDVSTTAPYLTVLASAVEGLRPRDVMVYARGKNWIVHDIQIQGGGMARVLLQTATP